MTHLPHLPIDEATAVDYIASRVLSRREASPHEAYIDTLNEAGALPSPEEEARQLYDLMVNPEPQRYFPQHAVDMVRLNRAFMTACTRAYIDRQLDRIWQEGGRPWLVTS